MPQALRLSPASQVKNEQESNHGIKSSKSNRCCELETNRRDHTLAKLV